MKTNAKAILTILLIEDEPEMQRGLRDNLEFEGYKVDVAGSGKDGLKKMLAGRALPPKPGRWRFRKL